MNLLTGIQSRCIVGPFIYAFFVLGSLLPTAAAAAKYALLVGIADYQYLPAKARDGMTDLKGPANDLRIMFEALTSRYGFPQDGIQMLSDREATRQNIVDAFKHGLIDRSRPGDLAVFYFAGHGSQVPDQNGDESDGLDEVLCPYDLVPKGGRNLILDDELGQWLSLLRERTTVVIIDSCHSGGAMRNSGDVLERHIAISDYQPTSGAFRLTRGADVPDHAIFMAAASEYKRSLEMRMDNGYHGVFSYSLCQAMQKSSLDSYDTLFQYAATRVAALLQNRGLLQKPLLIALPMQQRRVAFDQSPADIKDFQKNRLDRFLQHFDPRVSVALTALGKTSNTELKAIRRKILALGDTTVVKHPLYHDFLVQVDKHNHRFLVQLTNNCQQQWTLGPFTDTEQIVTSLHSPIRDYQSLKKLVSLRPSHPCFRLDLQPGAENRYDYKVGDELELAIRSEIAGHFILLSANREGGVYVLIPNPAEPGVIPGDGKVHVPTPGMNANDRRLMISPPVGEEMIKIISTAEPLNLRWPVCLNQVEARGKDMATGRTLHQFLSKLIHNEMQWSAAAIVIQSHH